MIFDQWRGKVAIVTGGNRGVGEGIAEVLQQCGMQIVIAARDKTLNQKKVDEIQNQGGQAISHSTDVFDETEVRTMVDKTLDKYSTIDVLVNKATVDPRDPWDQITPEVWDRTQEVNVKGYYLCAKHAAQPMIRQHWGRVINISSSSFFMGHVDALHYVTSKGANIAMTRSLAKEMAHTGVTVNCVAPGAVETPKESELGDEEYCRRSLQKILAAQLVEGRLQATDIGWLTAYLCTEVARFITGQTIDINGGRSFH